MSDPAYHNAGGNTTPDAYTVRPEGAFLTTGRPSGAQGAPDPYRRWGTSEWIGQYVDNWDGWGFRHINAKHGWSEADEAATRQALLTPLHHVDGSTTQRTYFGETYTQNGAICERTVVVEFGEHTGPKGIITSFGGFVSEAP